MAVTQGKTLEDLRKAVGRNLGKMITGTATGGSTSTTVDTSLFGGDDEYNGSYIHFTSGNKIGTTHRVSDYTSSSQTLTHKTTTSGAIADGVTYELWESGFDPDVIDEYINQAIWEITGRVYDPVENLDVHTDRINARWEIPSGINMIQDIYYRDKFTVKQLHNCNTAFDESVDSDFTITADTEDYKTGSASNKIVIAVGASAGDKITDSITSVNLAKYDYIEFWIKSTAATSAGNLKIHLDNGTVTADGNDLESLNVPALTEDTWKYCRVALNNPHTDTAIVSIGLEYDSDLGACTIHLDDIKAVKNDTAVWEKLPRDTWRIDKEGTTQGASTADLVLSDRGRALASYRLIKLSGGDVPAELSADSDTTEVPERYIVAYATALAAQAGSVRPDIDVDGMRNIAAFWFAKSEQARNDMPFLSNVRTVR